MKNQAFKSFLILAIMAVAACRPAQKDPPFNFNHNRQDAKVQEIKLDPQNPLNAIGAPSFWKRTTGKLVDGTRVKIGMVGTGVDYTNVDIRDSLWINLGEYGDSSRANGFDDDQNGYTDDIIGYDFFSGDSLPYDWNGHDTYTAALIASTAKTNSKVVGVAPNAELIIARYIGPDGRGNGMDAAEALLYAANAGAKVIYFNWPEGGFNETDSPLVVSILKEITSKNAIVVTPAGNSGNQSIPVFLKEAALIPGVVVVAGLDQDGKIKATSNSGKALALTAAPSVGSISYLPGSELSNDISTTSVAAAYVTGAVALLSTLPDLGNAQKIRMALLGNAVDRKASAKEPLSVLSDGPLFIGNF